MCQSVFHGCARPFLLCILSLEDALEIGFQFGLFLCNYDLLYSVISHRKLKKFHDRANNGETNIGSYIDETLSIGTAAAHYIDDTSSIGTQ